MNSIADNQTHQEAGGTSKVTMYPDIAVHVHKK